MFLVLWDYNGYRVSITSSLLVKFEFLPCYKPKNNFWTKNMFGYCFLKKQKRRSKIILYGIFGENKKFHNHSIILQRVQYGLMIN